MLRENINSIDPGTVPNATYSYYHPIEKNKLELKLQGVMGRFGWIGTCSSDQLQLYLFLFPPSTKYCRYDRYPVRLWD